MEKVFVEDLLEVNTFIFTRVSFISPMKAVVNESCQSYIYIYLGLKRRKLLSPTLILWKSMGIVPLISIPARVTSYSIIKFRGTSNFKIMRNAFKMSRSHIIIRST